jgi:hypothetical protein
VEPGKTRRSNAPTHISRRIRPRLHQTEHEAKNTARAEHGAVREWPTARERPPEVATGSYRRTGLSGGRCAIRFQASNAESSGPRCITWGTQPGLARGDACRLMQDRVCQLKFVGTEVSRPSTKEGTWQGDQTTTTQSSRRKSSAAERRPRRRPRSFSRSRWRRRMPAGMAGLTMKSRYPAQSYPTQPIPSAIQGKIDSHVNRISVKPLRMPGRMTGRIVLSDGRSSQWAPSVWSGPCSESTVHDAVMSRFAALCAVCHGPNRRCAFL